jgi:hypothetical protein
MHEDSHLDPLIERALSTYADADAGLERRVMARIAGERKPARGFGRIVWVGRLLAAACLLLVFAVVHHRPARAPLVNVHDAPKLLQAPLMTEAPILPRVSQQRQRFLHREQTENAGEKSAAARLPKQEMFPMQRPLSPEEQVLADFAAQAPETERKSLIETKEQMEKPIQLARIRIDGLNIPPLESPQAGTN